MRAARGLEPCRCDEESLQKNKQRDLILEKVKKLIASELMVDESKITLETRLSEDLGADSLDAVELIMAIEDEFGIQVDDEMAQQIRKVGDIVEFLEKEVK